MHVAEAGPAVVGVAIGVGPDSRWVPGGVRLERNTSVVRNKLVVELELEFILVLFFVFIDFKAKTNAWTVPGPAVLTVLDVRVEFLLGFKRSELEISNLPVKAAQRTEVRLEPDRLFIICRIEVQAIKHAAL